MGQRGRAFQDCMGFIKGCLTEELNMGEGRMQDVLQKNMPGIIKR